MAASTVIASPTTAGARLDRRRFVAKLVCPPPR